MNAVMSRKIRILQLSRLPERHDAVQEAMMGAVMIKCPATGKAIPTGLRADAQSFGRTPVFMAVAFCPVCQSEHEWFAQEAWVQEPGAKTIRQREAA